MIAALTAYGVQIPRAFADRASAIRWAEQEGSFLFPGCQLVEQTPNGPLTIWRHVEQVAA